MKFIFIAFVLIFTESLFGQLHSPIMQFKTTDYSSSKFTIKNDTAQLGQLQIIISIIHPKKNANVNFMCRSWLLILKNQKIIQQKYFDTEPVGGCSGLYAPTKQPCKDFFIFSKFGDYEGLTLVIDTSGKITTLTGGSFSISKDKKYLFSTFDSDISGITIYDLMQKKIILSKENNDDNRYFEFYFQDGNYYVSFLSDSNLKVDSIGLIDINNKKIKLLKKPNTFLIKTNKLKVYNDIQTLKNCNCGQ